MTVRYLLGDTREVVASLPAASVDLVLTSPPFLALRSYLPADDPNKHLEIGSDPHPAAFIDTMLGLTAEWRRVLAPHGSIAVEFGDTYSGSGGAGGDYLPGGLREGQNAFGGSGRRGRAADVAHDVASLCVCGHGRFDHFAEHLGNLARCYVAGCHCSDYLVKVSPDGDSRQGGERKMGGGVVAISGAPGWPLPKSLALVPELYRVGLAYGINPLTGEPSPAGRWRVRNVVRWVRPNPPVGALGDKFRPATSDLVIACVAGDRWFDLDAVRTEHARDYTDETPGGATEFDRQGKGRKNTKRELVANPAGAPPLDWWEIAPGGYSGSHYAVFPPELCVRPIEAMCPRRVCRTCGKPSRREVGMTPEYAAFRQRQLQRVDSGSVTDRDAVIRPTGFVNAGTAMNAEYTTTGWSTCGCPGTDGIRLDGFHTGTGWRPGIVLDPFGGSGTTGLVAHGHSRDAILIDLDARNVDLARERLGMFLDVA